MLTRVQSWRWYIFAVFVGGWILVLHLENRERIDDLEDEVSELKDSVGYGEAEVERLRSDLDDANTKLEDLDVRVLSSENDAVYR